MGSGIRNYLPAFRQHRKTAYLLSLVRNIQALFANRLDRWNNHSSDADDHPPTITISIPVGSAGENAAGELVVRPKSVVHLDCVFYRRLGSPSWVKTAEGNSSNNKSYPTGFIFVNFYPCKT